MINNRQQLIGVCLVTPALVGLLLFVLLPFLLAFALSVTNFRFGSPLATEFVGLTQYQRIFQDAVFQQAVINNCIFAVIIVPTQTMCALALALLLHLPLKGQKIFRTLLFMPVVFPLSLVSVVWIMLYAPGPEGLINSLLQVLSVGHWQAVDFLHRSGWALAAIIITSIWQGTGFQMVILLAALQSIPAQLYEAARLDGAGSLSQFWHITLPQLRHALTFVIMVTTILSFRLFDQVQIMTQGGPLNASTTIMYESVTAAFSRQQVATASAMTVVMFLMVLLPSLLQRLFSKAYWKTQ